MNARITRAFTTPIGYFRISNPDELNRNLTKLILEAESKSPSTRRSNIGGWRSDPTLFEWPAAPITELLVYVKGAIAEMLKATTGPDGFSGPMRIDGWANVLRNGNYNTIHNHPESVWSGVYYVDAGTPAEGDSLSGLLEFMDPRPFVEMVPAPGWPFGRPLRIQPESGLLILFPSWLYHQVHLYSGEVTRIAIAINAPMQVSLPR